MKGYLSIPEAAKKWGMSERLVNQRCIEGRVEGAERFGRSWAIPEDAPPPVRAAKGTNEAQHNKQENAAPAQREPRYIPMPLMNTPFAPGTMQEAAKAFPDAQQRALALAEAAYFSGQPQKAAHEAQALLAHPDLALRLSACWVYGYANLAMGNIAHARQALAQVNAALAEIDEQTPAETAALAGCVAMGAAVLLHLPLPDHLPPVDAMMPLLPKGLRLFAAYVQAHRAYLMGDYGGSLGIAQTALSLQPPPIFPIPSIYLHLVAAMALMSLKEIERAKAHLLSAWALAKSDDLIEAFGEHHGLLGGLLEAVIKREAPQDFERIIAITYRFSAGWRRVHNPQTGHDVADNLTTTEFAAAMLAARGWSNQEIGAHMGVSANTVKSHISNALQKLHIQRRRELKQFMLL